MDHLSPGQVIAIMVHLDPKDLILMRGVSKIFKQLVDSFLNHYGFECSCCGTNTLSRPKMVPNAKTRATIEKAMLMTAIRSEVFSRLTDEEFIMDYIRDKSLRRKLKKKKKASAFPLSNEAEGI